MVRISITSCLRDAEGTAYSRKILARYWEDGIPLSSNRVIHDLLIVFRNVLARVLAQFEPTSQTTSPLVINAKKLNKLHLPHDVEQTWASLMQKSSIRPIDKSIEKNNMLVKSIKQVYAMSIAYFEDIHRYAEKSIQEGKKWAPDAYMQEIMGTSMVSKHIQILLSSISHII